MDILQRLLFARITSETVTVDPAALIHMAAISLLLHVSLQHMHMLMTVVIWDILHQRRQSRTKQCTNTIWLQCTYSTKTCAEVGTLQLGPGASQAAS